jgi:non-homologous end joining protein Ku
MIEKVWLAALTAMLFTGATLAQGTPRGGSPVGNSPSTVDCLRRAAELADSAEAKEMSEDRIDLIEDMLTRMEAHCDAKEFEDALALAQQIRNAIDSD